MRLFPVGAMALLLSASPLMGDAIRSRQEDLRRLKRELDRKRRESKDADRRARELEQEVSRISNEMASSRRSLKEVESRLRETERRREDAENRLWASRLDLKQWNRTLSGDLRVLYERSAAAENARFMELAWRRSLVKGKVAAVSAAAARHAENRASHEELVAVKNEFEALHRRREKEAERVREAKNRMTGLLDTVQGRKAVLEKDIQDLNASAKRFESLIQDLLKERQAREARDAAAAAKAASAASARDKGKARGRKAAKASRSAASAPDFGKLPWPIEGAVVARFGKFKHPELDTYVVSNGIKIRPRQPGPIRAVAKGEVLYAGEFMGYGLMALVAHPDSLFSIYAQLGDLHVDKGQKVSVGEVLGRSGTDGEDRPLAYFELRLHGEAMDPLLWLK